MQILRFHPRPIDLEMGGTQPSVFSRALHVVLMQAQVWRPLVYNILPNCLLSSKLRARHIRMDFVIELF